MDRYLLLARYDPDGKDQAAFASLRAPAWCQVTIGNHIQLYYARPTRICGDAEAAIIGSAFARGMREPVARLPPSEWAAVRSSAGRVFTERYWGHYLAILAEGKTLRIVRAPFGALPCYWRLTPGGAAFASDLDLLALAGPCRYVDPSALARYLAREDCLSDETCLQGVREIRGGDRLTMTAGRPISTDTSWTPWDFAGARAKQFDDAEEAVRRLGDAVRLSVAATTSGHDHVVLLLSGGLDSSVVAASLADAGRPFTGLNLVSDNAGDERIYARQVADACGAALLEWERDPAGIDLARSLSAGQPRPMTRAFRQETHRLVARAVHETGATASVDGGGGDNVFYAYLSVAPLAELLRLEGFSARFRAKAAAMSSLSKVSYPKVVYRAIWRAWRPASVTRLPDWGYLSNAARDAADAAAWHPWMTAPRGIGAGTASAVSLLPQVQGYVESRDPRAPFPALSPLMTQPVVQTCLRIPSWMWFEDWNSRVIARRAFASRLPASVIARQSKGTPEAFDGALLESRWTQIADMLLGGRLRAEGLLDVGAVERALARNQLLRDHDFGRIMRLVDAEAWFRSWT